MFKISFMNVGKDMITKDMITTVDTLAEAEKVAKAEISKCIGVNSGVVFKQSGIEYVVEKDNVCVGSVVITGK